MHVNDLASLKILMIEVAYNELAASDIGQEFSLGDLLVLSMSLDPVCLCLLIVRLYLSKSLLSQTTHYFLFFLVLPLKLFIVTSLFETVLLVDVVLYLVRVNEFAFLIFELLFDLDGLVLDGFLHDHV